jgi:hypothetical protein
MAMAQLPVKLGAVLDPCYSHYLFRDAITRCSAAHVRRALGDNDAGKAVENGDLENSAVNSGDIHIRAP